MTMTITVPRIARQIELTTFADLTASVLLTVRWGADSLLAMTFATDLTTDERIAVKIRCLTYGPADEAVLASAYAAYKTNLTYLAIGTPTTAQVSAQVRTLTQQMQGVFRYLAPID